MHESANQVIVGKLLTTRECTKKLGLLVPIQRKTSCKVRQKCSLSSIFVLFALPPPRPISVFRRQNGSGRAPSPFALGWRLTFVVTSAPSPPPQKKMRGHKTLTNRTENSWAPNVRARRDCTIKGLHGNKDLNQERSVFVELTSYLHGSDSCCRPPPPLTRTRVPFWLGKGIQASRLLHEHEKLGTKENIATCTHQIDADLLLHGHHAVVYSARMDSLAPVKHVIKRGRRWKLGVPLTTVRRWCL